MIRKSRKDKGQPRKYYAGRPCKHSAASSCKSHVVFEDCSSSIKYEDLEKYIGKHVAIGKAKDRALLTVIDNTPVLLSNVKGWYVVNSLAAVAFPIELSKVNKEKFKRGWWITTKKDFEELNGVYAIEPMQFEETEETVCSTEETISSDDKDVITFLKEITQILKDINDRI